MKEAEKDEAILTFRRSVIRSVFQAPSIRKESDRKNQEKREGKIALKALKKELQKSHRRKAVRTQEARTRRRRSRKSETHLFRRTCQRIEVTIKENFKRKRNLSDQLNNKNNNKLFLFSEGNQEFRGRGTGADAPTEQQRKTP